MTTSASRCACPRATLERVKRKWWMRLIPNVRYYRCPTCDRHQLVRQARVSEAVSRTRLEATTAKASATSAD